VKQIDPGTFDELAEGLNHPEGVAWNAVDGHVYAGGEGGELYRVSLEGDVDELATTGGSMLGLAVDGLGRIYACDEGNGEIVQLDPSTGAVKVYARGPSGGDLDTPNALAFDPAGFLYVTCSGEGGDPMIVRISPGGEDVVTWSRDVPGYPNGVAVDPAGDGLIVVEAHAQRLVRLAIGTDGSAGPPAVIAELPGTDPDGVSLDAAGGLWVTLYRPDGLVRVVDGEVDVVVDDRLAHTFDAPTNLAWVGPSLDRAVVANVGDRFLSIGDLGVRGAAPHAPVFP
jgi:sugar lactone lactonase YvrE